VEKTMKCLHPIVRAAVVALGLAAAATAAAQSATPPPAGREPGIYLEQPGEDGKPPTRLVGVRVAEIHPKGILKVIATSGFAKGDLLGRISGEHAALRLSDNPVFDFHLPSGESKTPPRPDPNAPPPTDMDQMMRSMGGDIMPSNLHDASDFALIPMSPKDGGREAHLGTFGGRFGGHGPKGVIACTVEKLGNGVFRVHPNQPLAPGEYAFAAAKDGQAGQVWDFGIDSK
jgi:hypothetical protein